MARGVRKSIDEKIELINQDIDKAQKKLDFLNCEKDKLLQLKREEELESLYHLITSKNLSVDCVAELIEHTLPELKEA